MSRTMWCEIRVFLFLLAVPVGSIADDTEPTIYRRMVAPTKCWLEPEAADEAAHEKLKLRSLCLVALRYGEL